MYLISSNVYASLHLLRILIATYEMLEQVSNDQKGRLLMTTERLNQSTDRLTNSRKTLLETEELGVSILQDLHQQRQSLLHAHKSVSSTT